MHAPMRPADSTPVVEIPARTRAIDSRKWSDWALSAHHPGCDPNLRWQSNQEYSIGINASLVSKQRLRCVTWGAYSHNFNSFP